MVVRFLKISILLTLFISCAGYKNEFDKRRFNYDRFSIKANTNKNAFQIIDTTRLYKRIYTISKTNNEVVNLLGDFYLKFYPKGRVGRFHESASVNTKCLIPERAEIGRYRLDNGILIMQFFVTHPEGNFLLTKQLIKANQDTLIIGDDFYQDSYKVLELPKELIGLKPDW